MTSRTKKRTEEDEAIAWQMQYEEEMSRNVQAPNSSRPDPRLSLHDEQPSSTLAGRIGRLDLGDDENYKPAGSSSSLSMGTPPIMNHSMDNNYSPSPDDLDYGNNNSLEDNNEQPFSRAAPVNDERKYSEFTEEYRQPVEPPSQPKAPSGFSRFTRLFSRKPAATAGRQQSDANDKSEQSLDGSNEQKPIAVTVIDNSSMHSSDMAVLQMKRRAEVKTAVPVKTNADLPSLNPKSHDFNRALAKWCQSVIEIHSKSNPDRVFYSKRMPNVEILMNDWKTPLGFEVPPVQDGDDDHDDNIMVKFMKMAFPEGINAGDSSLADLDCLKLSEFAKVCCLLVDIPVYESEYSTIGRKPLKTPSNGADSSKYLVESLHVLFSLYLEFRNSGHFGKTITK